MTLDLDRALDLVSSLRLESGQRWADVAADFQWATARWALDPAVSPYRWDSRPRGGSKTTDAAARCAVLMVAVLPPGSSLSAFAVDRDQARLLGDALRDSSRGLRPCAGCSTPTPTPREPGAGCASKSSPPTRLAPGDAKTLSPSRTR